jgi:hypothetical protein
MLLDSVGISCDIDWGSGENPVSEVKLYVQAQEEVNGTKMSYGHDTDKVLAVISNFSADGKFQLYITAEDIYDLFKDDFDVSQDRSEVPIMPDDLYEITWKLVGTDGKVFDSKTDCFGIGCQYSLGVDKDYNKFWWWEGTFDYEWIVVSDGVLSYSYGDIVVGTTGTIEFTPIQIGDNGDEYDIPHTMFYYWWSTVPGTLYFNENTGEIFVEGDEGEEWTVSNVNGNSLDISWTYEWTDYYDEYGTVRLTRTDGLDWPANIHTD